MTGRDRIVTTVIFVCLALAISSCASVTSRHDAQLDPAPTTVVLPDLLSPRPTLPPTDDVSLGVVDGELPASEITIAGGATSLRGSLSANGAATAGATVLVERIVGAQSASLTTVTDSGGRWAIEGLVGGRYRLRAWRAPDVAVTQPAIFFADAGTTASIDLVGQLVGPYEVSAAAAPTQVAVDDDLNVAFRLESRSVDAAGVIRTTPLAGIGVTVDSATNASLAPGSPPTRSTRADGQVQWTMRCSSPGALSVAISFGLEGGASDSRTFQLAQCG
jgi:hypothetical protein